MSQVDVNVPGMGRPAHSRDTARFAAELRGEMPWSEARLWSAINRRQLGVRFRRQIPVGPYVADFGCLDPRIVIEVDGPSHDWVDEERRNAYLAHHGFRILRFNNEEIRDALDGVCEEIRRAIEDR